MISENDKVGTSIQQGKTLQSDRNWRLRVWEMVGRVFYYCTWPGIWLVIRLTPPRTRIVVRQDNKILLTKDWLGSGEWNVPGGGLHRNEADVDGAVRELFEETGISVHPNELNSVHVTSSDLKILGTSRCFFVELPNKPVITLQKIEILDHIWISESELDTIRMSPIARTLLEALSRR